MTWLACRSPKPDPRVRLLCFPYAGGNAVTYRPWDGLLPATVELHVAQLPGRMPRMAEAPLASIAALADQLAAAAKGLSATTPLALFGHSMGAVCAFEVARRLTAAGRPPAYLFVSARQAPQLPWRRPKIHGLPEREFVDAIKALSGTPPEVLADRELMGLVLPALRADFAAIESYVIAPGPKLPCNIGLFGGREDPHITVDDLLGWQEQTAGQALLELRPGGHFFIDKDPAPVVATVVKDLTHLLGDG
jgi:surfactin synthase thioesterase subunit